MNIHKSALINRIFLKWVQITEITKYIFNGFINRYLISSLIAISNLTLVLFWSSITSDTAVEFFGSLQLSEMFAVQSVEEVQDRCLTAPAAASHYTQDVLSELQKVHLRGLRWTSN